MMMEIKIRKAEMNDLTDCAEILRHSKLGMMYFLNAQGEYHGEVLLKQGFERDDLYMAVDEEGNSVGFLWVQLNGIFNWFPFLHVVAVKEECRGQGIGKKLLEYFDHIAFVEDGSREAFLMVGDYNQQAIELYERVGYTQVGAIPELFVRGVTELLMMKRRGEGE